ncbi:MAG: GNAT family N-acetyltransferase [Oscillospiraceae bacterium]|jgi:GNAT superfamily N-acetyltransferase|nr:GNAT family N-acetyltransferase [Oscillospiraceae bacterium]
MITAEFTPEEITAACSRDVLGTQLFTGWRLNTLYPAQIGKTLPARAVCPDGAFWIQRTDGAITAAIGCIQHAVILTANPHADFEELRTFLQSFGGHRLECMAEIASRLGFAANQIMYIQRRATDGKKQRLTAEYKHVVLVPEAYDFKPVYDLWLAAGFGEYMSGYPDWLAAIVRKQKSGLGEIYALLDGKTLLATAAVFGRTEDAAYLGGVAVRSDLRGRGLGAAVVDYAIHNADTNCAELLCAEHNREFYRKCGFEGAGTVSFAEI